MTKVINLFGGPGVSKSTMATGVFSLLKMHDVNCEYVSEFAKDLVWESNEKLINTDPLYIFSTQYLRQRKLQNKVDIMITDSPLLMTLAYYRDPIFSDIVINTFNRYDNYNYFLERKKKYHTAGRLHTEKEAIQKDKEIKDLLKEFDVEYKRVPGNFEGLNMVALDILTDLGLYMNIKLTKYL